MPNDTTHVSKMERGQKIQILDKSYNLRVEAALPETYSIGNGSEIGSPFAGFATDNMVAKALTLTTGVSNKIGLVTKRMFMGPQTPDINLTLHFEAFYSAYDEVLRPCATLLMMASGEKGSLANMKELQVAFDLQNAGVNAGKWVAGQFKDEEVKREAEEAGKKADMAELIKFIRSPGLCRVYFGDTHQLDDVYVASANVTFSNILDKDFIPMSATVDVTLATSNPMTKNSLESSFGKSAATYRRQVSEGIR